MLGRLRQWYWKEYYRRRGNKELPDTHLSGRDHVDNDYIKNIFSDIIRKLALSKEDHLLDIGCANGAFEAYVADRVGRVTGVDIASGLIEKARQRHEERGQFHFYTGAADQAFQIDEAVRANKILCYSVLQLLHSGVLRTILRQFSEISPSSSLFLIGDLVKPEEVKLNKKCRNRFLHRFIYTRHNPVRIEKICSELGLSVSFDFRENSEHLNPLRYDAIIRKG